MFSVDQEKKKITQRVTLSQHRPSSFVFRFVCDRATLGTEANFKYVSILIIINYTLQYINYTLQYNKYNNIYYTVMYGICVRHAVGAGELKFYRMLKSTRHDCIDSRELGYLQTIWQFDTLHGQHVPPGVFAPPPPLPYPSSPPPIIALSSP